VLPFAQGVSARAFQLLTLEHYAVILETPEYLSLVGNTVLIAAATATVATTLSALAAWLVAHRAPASRAISGLSTTPLVFPGIVLGVGIMQLFLRVPLPIYGTVWIMIWAFVIAYLPYGMRYCSSGLLQIHREMEEASFVSGASPFFTLRRITLPLLSPSLAAGWLFIFLVSARVLSLAILLAGPSSQTLAVAMFDLWTNGQGPELAALGLMWAAAVSAVIALFYGLLRRMRGGLIGFS
jgi:iron(III) transport system permease protein